MIKPMFGHRPKPKKFDLPFRYYDPAEDERRRRRISFERNFEKRRSKQNSRVLLYAALLFGIMYIISIL